MVLLHGWAMNSQVWPKEVLEKLPVKWILVDLPGHGQSSDIAFDENIDVVLKQLKAVTPDDAIWIGWSLGGMLATAMAAKYKTRVRRLGLIASSPKFTKDKDWQNAMDENVLAKFSENLSNNVIQTIKRFIALQFLGVPNAKEQITAIQKQILDSYSLNTPALLVGLNYLKTLNLLGLCKTIKQPSFGLYGRLDGLVPIKAIPNIVGCFKATQFNTIVSSKSGHAPFLNDSDTFEQFIKQILADDR